MHQAFKSPRRYETIETANDAVSKCAKRPSRSLKHEGDSKWSHNFTHRGDVTEWNRPRMELCSSTLSERSKTWITMVRFVRNQSPFHHSSVLYFVLRNENALVSLDIFQATSTLDESIGCEIEMNHNETTKFSNWFFFF